MLLRYSTVLYGGHKLRANKENPAQFVVELTWSRR